MAYRLLALDLDGTLLDPRGELQPAVADAVTRVRDRGLEVVICTGRRHRTTLPFLERLGLTGPVVTQNGAVVRGATGDATLWHDYLSADAYAAALPLMRRVCPPLVYVDHPGEDVDFLSEPLARSHPYQVEYVEHNSGSVQIVESLGRPASGALVMLVCLADEDSLRSLRTVIDAELAGSVRTNFLPSKNYSGHILEVVSATSGKWPALEYVARLHGIAPEEIVALGDEMNDVEMLERAGLGIAMGNAVEDAKRAADEVTEDNAANGAAIAIERWVLGERTGKVRSRQD